MGQSSVISAPHSTYTFPPLTSKVIWFDDPLPLVFFISASLKSNVMDVYVGERWPAGTLAARLAPAYAEAFLQAANWDLQPTSVTHSASAVQLPDRKLLPSAGRETYCTTHRGRGA